MTSFVSLAAPNIDIEHKGKKYLLSALTFKDFGEYILWYQFKELRIAEVQTKEFPPDLQKQILADTYNKCLSKCWSYIDENTGEEAKAPLSWETPEIQKSLNQVDGIAYQLYLCLKHKHPEITEELADEIVTVDIYKNILGKLLIVQGLTPEEDENKESSEGEVKSPIQ